MRIYFIPFILIAIVLPGCNKFLDKKSNQKLVIPSSIQDLQGLVDQYLGFNQGEPSAPEISADDYYVTSADLAALSSIGIRNMYTWEPSNLFDPGQGNAWTNLYNNIYRTNVVVAELPKIKRSGDDDQAYSNCLGQALYFRGHCFLQALWIWAPAYDPVTSSVDPGIALRLDPDFNKVSVRSNVHDCYNQVLTDLKQALHLLPVTPLHILRPSKPAACGLLARAYLSMRMYDSSFKYADLCLQYNLPLMDYNNDPSITSSSLFPFARFNKDELIDSYFAANTILLYNRAKIDSSLYDLYDAQDLRKTLFFNSNGNNTYGFRGTYQGNGAFFNGLATGEIYLMRAECYARAGSTELAMGDLNTLLIKRWKTNSLTPLTAATPQQALDIILTERRKELLMRGLRWMDIKRLNKEGRNIVLKRIINNTSYKLEPNDPRYALPLPEDVIQLSGMEQNKR